MSPSLRRLACLAGSLLFTAAVHAEDVVIVVNQSLRPLIETELTRLAADLAADGHAVTLRTWNLAAADQDEPAELKAYLASLAGLDGAILIGDLPIANYYHANDWYGSGATFPCDLYYMSQACAWTDGDGDGTFDGVVGTPVADIWVSRIKASNLGGLYSGLSEAELVQRYLDKNHRFRTGALRLPDRALQWSDNDWSGHTPASLSLSDGYADCTRVTNEVSGISTTKADWQSRWTTAYETEHFMCHSSESAHYPGGSHLGSSEVAAGDIMRLFWNAWNCSAGNYAAQDYIAGARLFTRLHGLVAVATTKTGSLYPFAGFYDQLGAGASHGNAFKAWFSYAGGAYNTSDSLIAWRFGMTLLGDGTLRLGRHSPAISEANHAPVAAADSYMVLSGTTNLLNADLGVLRNDRDREADLLSAILVSSVQHGSLSLAADGSFSYTPSPGYSGSDAFVYRAGDGSLQSGPVTVTLVGLNSPPVADNQGVSTLKDTARTITLVATDVNGDPLTWMISQPAHGTLTGSGPGVTYTPAAGYTGADAFTFRVNDGLQDSPTATVSITVSAPGMMAWWKLDEASGVAVADATGNGHTGTLQGGAVWTVNGHDAGALQLTAEQDRFVVSPQLTLASEWTISSWFTAPLPATGSWHTLTRSATNDHHVITDSALNLGMYDNSTGGAFRSCGYNLGGLSAGWHHLAAVGSGTTTAFYVDGVLVGSSDRRAASSDIYAIGNYQGGGQRFAERIDDVRVYNHALTPAQIAGLVGTPNRAPVITEGATATVTMSEDGAPTAFSLTLHASDGDGDALDWSIPSAPAHGTATVSGPGTVIPIGYTPTGNYAGTDSFVVQVSDGHGGTDTIAVSVTITGVNDAPVVDAGPDQVITLPAQATLSGSVADDDAKSVKLGATWSVVSGPGRMTFANNRLLATTASFRVAGTYVLRLTVSDGSLSGSDEIAVTAIAGAIVPDGSTDAQASGGGGGCGAGGLAGLWLIGFGMLWWRRR